MKILITGARGKLGNALYTSLSTHYEVIGFDIDELDICSFPQTLTLIRTLRPAILINAAAYTAVDRCEDEPEAAYRLNALGVRNLATGAEEVHAKFIHFSTDFVFEGNRQGPPYHEYDSTHPQSVYGKSKLAGEEEALRICERSTVLRLAWLYGPGGWNFTDWVVAELRQQRPVKIVTDQIGCPTWVGDVTRQVERLLKESAYGLYHSANTGFCSRYDWACEAARIAKGDSSLVIPVTSNEFKQKAPRPTYSAMDDLCLRHQDLLVMRTWQEALGEHLGR